MKTDTKINNLPDDWNTFKTKFQGNNKNKFFDYIKQHIESGSVKISYEKQEQESFWESITNSISEEIKHHPKLQKAILYEHLLAQCIDDDYIKEKKLSNKFVFKEGKSSKINWFQKFLFLGGLGIGSWILYNTEATWQKNLLSAFLPSLLSTMAGYGAYIWAAKNKEAWKGISSGFVLMGLGGLSFMTNSQPWVKSLGPIALVTGANMLWDAGADYEDDPQNSNVFPVTSLISEKQKNNIQQLMQQKSQNAPTILKYSPLLISVAAAGIGLVCGCLGLYLINEEKSYTPLTNPYTVMTSIASSSLLKASTVLPSSAILFSSIAYVSRKYCKENLVDELVNDENHFPSWVKYKEEKNKQNKD